MTARQHGRGHHRQSCRRSVLLPAHTPGRGVRRRHVPAARRSVRRGISRMLARGITRAHGRAHGRIFPRVMVRARASCCPGQGPSSGWRSPGCRPVRSRGKSPSVIRWWPERLPAEARAASRAVIRQSSGYHRSLGISRPGSHECRVVAAATDTNPVTGVRVRRGTTGAHGHGWAFVHVVKDRQTDV
jgi:hypothetical protein